MNEIKEGFSIVICTYNGVSKLTPTLKHIANLNCPDNITVEVILVNNGSTDDTEKFSKNLWIELNEPHPLIINNEIRPGKGFATETGYDAAQYSYIITVDDDNWLAPDYLINALELIHKYNDVGIFQARNEPVFESTPPGWIKGLEGYMVIGSPIKGEGYFDKNYYGVWGAGMIIRKDDWNFLRRSGFAALTSKVPGKAAGEDVELALALLLTGKKIYYSRKLQYKHYMPASRIQWQVLQKNFEVFAYTAYYFFLYSLIFDAYKQGYTITKLNLQSKFLQLWLKMMKSRGVRGNLNYFFSKKKILQQLQIRQYYYTLYWFVKGQKTAMHDIAFIQQWMLSLLKTNPGRFEM